MGRRRTPLSVELQMLSRRMAGLAAGQGGAVTADQARLLGADAAAIRRLVGAGEWGRPRRGIYRDLTAPAGATLLSTRPGDRPTAAAVARAAQHHARCADLLAALRPARGVVSHTSALTLLGLPLPPRARDRVVITRAPPASANRLGEDSEVHVARFDEADVLDVGGVPVLGGARLVLDCCATMAPESALAVADAAVWRHLVDPEDLMEAVRRFRGRPGARRAELVADRMDPLAESWFESASRWWLLEAGLPRPRLQVPFRDEHGVLRAKPDMWFPEFATVGEADGAGKYDEPGALFEEKRREDWLRDAHRVEVVRWVPVEMRSTAGRAEVAARFERAFARRSPSALQQQFDLRGAG